MPTEPASTPPYTWDGDLGRNWVRFADLMDPALERFGFVAMDALAVQPGMRVLDIGCGCGATTLELARRAGDTGNVTGIDISGPMIERARERAAEARLAHAHFEVADAANAALDGPFDAAFSRFGVMFFEQPIDAFANLRASLRVEARLAFVCWQERAQNPWQAVPIAAAQQHLELPPPRPPREPGGAAFAEPEYVHEVLAGAGFVDVDLEPFVDDLPLPGGTDLDAVVETMLATNLPFATGFRSASAEARRRAVDAIARAIEPFATERGYYLRGSTWIVTATA